MNTARISLRKTCLRAIAGAALLSATLAVASQAAMDPDLFEGLHARLIGPAGMSGRIAIIDSVASDPNIIYVGAATGGVWKSTDGGLVFTPIFDKEPVHSIGALAVNQQNPDIVWVGTGEPNTRNSVSIGNGVYKSIDAGRTWQHIGLEGTERINWIALDPTDPDVAYVAALGTLWGPNTERGVFKTTDGGKTWNKILYVDENTGANDIEMDPTNPNRLFVSMWQFRRHPYEFKSGGPGSSLWRTLDGGATWTKITEEDGLPAGEWGRADFAIAPSDPKTVYLILETKDNNVAARSDDGGFSWTVTNEKLNNTARPFYYTEIHVDPKNSNRVYNVQSTVLVSIDGAKTFTPIPGINCCGAPNAIHIDTHTLWIDPRDPERLIVGNDGGVALSTDMGATWRHVTNLPLAQFYHVRVDNDLPYNVYGGLQDNGSWRGPSEVWENGGIRNFHWQEVFFGDGFDTMPDPEDSQKGYAMAQGGTLVAYDMHTGAARFIQPEPPDAGTVLRFNWNAGMAQDPFNPATIYYGSQFLHTSTDHGVTWQIISPDLTTNNKDWQTFNESGGFTPDVTTAENYESIIAIAPSPVEAGVIWVGTDDGRLHVTRDSGKTWTSLDGKARGVPANTWIPHITPSPTDAGTAFIVYDNHRRSDMKPYVFRADNYGARFTSLATPDVKGYALSIQQDPVNPSLLFLGTEFGLYVSFNGGGNWMKWSAGLPTASVMDLAIQPRESDLVVGTHGRAIFVIDDYSALRKLSEADFKERLKLLAVADGIAYISKQSPSIRFDGATGFRGENQPYGAMITFIASGEDLPYPDADKEKARKIAQRQAKKEGDKAPPEPKVTVEVKDAAGKTVRTFKADIHQGINRIEWNLSADGAKNLPVGPPPADDTLPAGPTVVPGAYTLTLKFGGKEASGAVAVKQDPRTTTSMEELQANFDDAQTLNAMQTEAADAIQRILDAKADLGTLKDLAAKAKKKAPKDEAAADAGEEKADNPYDAFTKDADAALDKLKELEKKFWTPQGTKGFVDTSTQITSYIGQAGFYNGSTFKAPSPAETFYRDLARAKLDEGLKELDTIFAEDIAKVRDGAAELNLGLLVGDAPPAPSGGEDSGA
jgi:photosystem II stability/assembly factor-like uncharacterized protein